MDRLLPAFTNNNIPIVFASSEGYVPYLSVAIESIIEHATAGYGYDIIILCKKIGDTYIDRICNMGEQLDNVSIRFLKVADGLEKVDFKYRSDSAAASESFYCTILQEVLPCYEKVICLDCDLVVQQDLSKLYETNIDDYMIAAVRDIDGIGNIYADRAGYPSSEKMKGRYEYVVQFLGISNINEYFQSGVMLINLKRWREKYDIEEILRIGCSEKIMFGDQDTMNYLCNGDVLYLDMKWNYVINHENKQLRAAQKYAISLVEEYDVASRNPYIIHYAGDKPWKTLNVDKYPYFWKYAFESPFYDEICYALEINESKSTNNKVMPFTKTSNKNKKSFIFSVIIPVYNAEAWLTETVDSVISQTIGFLDNIQIVFVNNATEDNCKDICDGYKKLYPDNVVCLNIEKNMGPCKARNLGLSEASGEIINFLDADDKWDKSTFQLVYDFFNKQKEIDVVACRIKHFDQDSNWHILDYKFASPKVCDIRIDYDYIQLNVGSTFIRGAVLKDIRWDEKIRHAEDAKFITDVIMKKNKYGLLPDAVFYYRKRKSGAGSLLEKRTNDEEYYQITPTRVYHYLLEKYRNKIDKPIYYVQYLVMYEIQWRLKGTLPGDEYTVNHKYITQIRDLLKQIEDFIICAQRNISNEQKLFCLSLKYGTAIESLARYKNNWFSVGSINFDNLSSGKALTLSNLQIKDKSIHMYGMLNLSLNQKDIKILLSKEANGKNTNIEVDLFDSNRLNSTKVFDEVYCTKKEFRVITDVEPAKYRFLLAYNGMVMPLNFWCGRFSKLSNDYSDSYYVSEGYSVQKKGASLEVNRCDRNAINGFEKKFRKQILSKLGKGEYIKRCFVSSILPIIKRGKTVILISDRVNSARDNGFEMLKYLCTNKEKNMEVAFILSKKSNDLSKVSKISKVIDPDTIIYKIMYLRADIQLCAYLENKIAYPFSPENIVFKDFIPDNLVYLQHGVIKDDFSTDQNYSNKNIKKFITSSVLERQSLIDLPYGYVEDMVPITGLARFDNLKKQSHRRIILIAPTWRAGIPGTKFNATTGKCDYNYSFTGTEYYTFYNELINNTRLLNVMKQYDIVGYFQLHPVIRCQYGDFKFNDMIVEAPENEPYENIVNSSDLLVTDYSSTAFDFAYEGKQTIYAQFDQEFFYRTQLYDKGYYDYELEGFGPVCHSLDETIEMIIMAIKKDFSVEDKYLKRINKAFLYRDNNNKQRIFEEMKKIL